MGDSLSAAYGIPRESGWVTHLQQRLQTAAPDYRVLNLSLSGETTQGGVYRLPHALQRYQPQLVVLELGANDGLRGFDLAQTTENLRQMIRLSQQAGAQVLLLGVRLPVNYGPDYRAAFQQMYADLAQQESVALVPLLLAGVAESRELMQPDGVHPNAAAQQQILQNVWSGLAPLLVQE
ncbi:MAG: arylesterase [Pseudomonadota bacterium]